MSIPRSVPDNYSCGQECSPGYYPAQAPSSWKTTLQMCQKCGKGYACPDGTSRTKCGAGSYSSSFTATSCTPCPTGTTTSGASPYTNSSQCSECVGGYEWKDNTCQKCSAGMFAASGRNTCQNCEKNSYSLAGASSCTRCMGNQITWVTNATQASDCHSTCPTGLAPFPQCDKAIAGYQITGNAGAGGSIFATAEKCPIGHFQSEISDGTCSACPIGTYADNEGSTRCTPCPSDKPFTKSTGSTDISFCIVKQLDCNTKGSTANDCAMKGVPPLTTDCKQDTCSIPGQLCQVPDKNVYSCCAYTLPKSEMNGGTIPPFDELPMKWQSMGNTKWPISLQNGGCLNYIGYSNPTTMAVDITPSDVGKSFDNTWTNPNRNVKPYTIGSLGMNTQGGAYYLKPSFGDMYPPYNPENQETHNYSATIANRKKCSHLASLQNRELQSPSKSSILIYFEGTGDPNTCAGSQSKGTPPTPSYYVDT